MYPDGSVPSKIRGRWEPWIIECLELMLDGYGTFRRFRYDLPLDEQPWIDLLIYRAVRRRFLELRREDAETDGQRRNGNDPR